MSEQYWRSTEEIGRVEKGARTSVRAILMVDAGNRGVLQIRKFKGDEPSGERINIPIEQVVALAPSLVAAAERYYAMVAAAELEAELTAASS